MVKGQEVKPYDFAVAYIIKERERILEETGFGPQRGAMSVVVKGTKTGQPQEYRVHMVSSDKALGEGTGIPAAVGAILLGQGRLKGKAVLPPEGVYRPQGIYRCRQAADGYVPRKGWQITLKQHHVRTCGCKGRAYGT
jgi:saccharopine dehydrogenase (NAD+, L-lysine-forming)